MKQPRTPLTQAPQAQPQFNLSPGHQPQVGNARLGHPLLRLQRTVGNRAVGRLIQAKLKIGSVGDQYEQEADRVAASVMRMPAPISDPLSIREQADSNLVLRVCPSCQEEIQNRLGHGERCPQCEAQLPREERQRPGEERRRIRAQRAQQRHEALRQRREREEETTIRRKEDASAQRRNARCEQCEREQEQLRHQPFEEEAEAVQRQEHSGDNRESNPNLGDRIQTMVNRGGQLLPKSLRTFMEARIGHDFSHVRLHTDANAAETARAANARAFTVGPNVVFGAGEYAPETSEGQQLLAHELTHVVQQSGVGSQLQRQPNDDDQSPELTPEETPMPALIVEDQESQLGPGQMRKSEFLSQLRTAVCAAADTALADTGQTTDGCPYLARWFDYYQNKDSRHIERAIHRYTPATRRATAAREYIPRVAERVQRGVERWAETGDLTDVPEELLTGLPGTGLLGAVSNLVSGVAGAISNLLGGARSERSEANGLLFKARPGGAQVGASPPSVQAQLGQGRPLEGGIRTQMETAFGVGLAHVRTHTDARGTRLADQFNARAFTIGDDIAFGSGQYQPGTLIGDALIAHELAHVVQQRAAGATSVLAKNQTPPHEPLEDDADRSAVEAVVSLWGGVQGRAAAIARRAMPQLRSGLRLSRCSRPRQFTQQALLNYLDHLRQGQIENRSDSHAKAREIIRRWQRGDSRYINLPVEVRSLLIQEMLTGSVENEDERAILDFLRGQEDAALTRIINTITVETLQQRLGEEARTELDSLLAQRGIGAGPTGQPSREVFPEEQAREVQERFMENALLGEARLNCIRIIHDFLPRLYEEDARLQRRVSRALRGLRREGRTFTIVHTGKAMRRLGLASQGQRILFNDNKDNRQAEPNGLESSAWDTIMSMVGNDVGWHIFGMSIFNGYHSVAVFVNNRTDGQRFVYWADQWAIGPGENFQQEEGSESGFRRYERAGFDGFINHLTHTWWCRLHTCDNRHWQAQLTIWKFYSRRQTRPQGSGRRRR